VGDPLYSKRAPIKGAAIRFHRQALHATALGLVHPHSGEALLFHAPPPKDHADLLERVFWNA
jgi:23S rRNA pseudouridine1911/1915/1917 synthase